MINTDKNVLQWLPLAQSLKDFLLTYTKPNGEKIFSGLTDYANLNVVIGSFNTARSYPCIEILLGSEEKESITTSSKKGKVFFWLDLWVDGALEDRPDYAYEQAYVATNDLANSLKHWLEIMMNDLKLGCNVVLKEVLSDGDSQRPLYQTRIVLEIDWRQ